MKFIIVIFAIFLTIAADEFVDQPPAETRYRGWPRFQFRRPTTESPIVPGDPPNPRDPPNSGDLPKPIGPPEVNRPLNPVGSPKGGDLPKPIGRLNPVVPPNDGELPKPDGSPEVNGPPDSGQPRDGDHPIDDNPFNREIPKISGDSTDQKVPVNPEVPKLPYSPPTEGSPVNPGQLMPAPPLMLAPTTSAPVILADPSPECVKLVKDFVEREYYRSFSDKDKIVNFLQQLSDKNCLNAPNRDVPEYQPGGFTTSTQPPTESTTQSRFFWRGRWDN